MTRILQKCPADSTYTLKAECPKCGEKTKSAHPPKYSKEDKYAAYRRKELYG
ncbi:MAG: RNA-protein complex protein Nop10 [Candidatus Micrarchaeota archaeon]